jgi:hypothetical protein
MAHRELTANNLDNAIKLSQCQASVTRHGLSEEPEPRFDVEILARLASIEAKLDALSQEKTVFEFYSVEEFAKRVNRSKFCVREWARLRRINALKRSCGRGRSTEWCISNEELIRFFNHGLLPDPRRSK